MADTPAASPTTLDDNDLLALLRGMEDGALGAPDSELAQDRETANDYYVGRAEGRLAPPTEPDRTSIVDRSLFEAVEWTLPELLRIFISGEPVEFVPAGPGDEAAARQETAVVNHIITQRNNGYLIFRTWFQDALVERNGYVHAFWDEQVEERIEEYANLAPEQVLRLSVDIALRGEQVEELERNTDELTGLTSLRLRVTAPRSYVHIENVPPERMRVSEDARFSLQEATYVARVETPTRTTLMGWGFDEDTVYGLPAEGGTLESSSAELARDVVEDESTLTQGAPLDPSMERVRVVQAWTRVDMNADGKAELWEIWYTNESILYKKEATCIPFASITPIPRPHRHIGLSYYDTLADIQEIQTLLSRQLLDNVFIANHNETAVRQGGIVDIDDFMIRRPGGLLRTVGRPADDILPMQHDTISHRIIPIIQHYDDRREVRTGIGRTSQGLDSEVLEKGTADAFQRGLAASSAMREGIARTFAETGVKDLMLLVHRLMIEHQDHTQMLRLGAAQQWIPVDPRQWRTRSQMVVKVGLGHHTRDQEVQALGLLSSLHEKMLAGGLTMVLPNNVYNLAEDMVRALGFPFRAGRYFTDPATVPPSQPQENPLVTVERIDAQTKLATEAAKIQSEEKQQVLDLLVKMAELRTKVGIEQFKTLMQDAARQADNALSVSERIATQEGTSQENERNRQAKAQTGSNRGESAQ